MDDEMGAYGQSRRFYINVESAQLFVLRTIKTLFVVLGIFLSFNKKINQNLCWHKSSLLKYMQETVNRAALKTLLDTAETVFTKIHLLVRMRLVLIIILI